MRMMCTENGPLFEGTPDELAGFIKELERLNNAVANNDFFDKLTHGIRDLPESDRRGAMDKHA